MQMMTTGSFFAVCPSLVSAVGLGVAVAVDDSAILRDSIKVNLEMSRCVCKLPDHNDILVSKDDDYLTKQAKSLRSRESAEAKVGFQAVNRTFKTNGLISRSYSLDAMPDNDIRSGTRLSPRQLRLTMESQEPTRIVIEQEKRLDTRAAKLEERSGQSR